MIETSAAGVMNCMVAVRLMRGLSADYGKIAFQHGSLSARPQEAVSSRDPATVPSPPQE